MSIFSAARTERGSILAEGVVALCLVIVISISMLFLLIEVASAVLFKIKLSTVTHMVARKAAADRYWLGAVRTDFKANAVQKAIYQEATVLSKEFGLPAPSQVTVDQSSFDICTVKVTADWSPPISGHFMAKAISRSEVAAEPYLKHLPIAIFGANWQVPPGSPSNLRGAGGYVPYYGADPGSAQIPGPLTLPDHQYPLWEGHYQGFMYGAFETRAGPRFVGY